MSKGDVIRDVCAGWGEQVKSERYEKTGNAMPKGSG